MHPIAPIRARLIQPDPSAQLKVSPLPSLGTRALGGEVSLAANQGSDKKKPKAVAVDGGWWLPLIEKVYAKANVNYEMLTTGSQSEAGQFLTGAPAKDFKSNQEGTDQTWIRLTEAL